MLADPRFDDRAGRAAHAEEVDGLMLPWLAEHGKREIFEQAQHLGLAFAYVASPGDILGWEHLRERDFFAEVDHPAAGRLEYPTGPFKADAAPWKLEPAPLLGQHNREILQERLDYSTDDLVRLREMDVI